MPPSPGRFLEVLIPKGLEARISEVLILGDLWARLLILLDFKSFIISDLIKHEEFAEVLILDGLGRAVGTDGWNFRLREGSSARASERDGCDPPRLLSGEDGGVVRITQRRRDSRRSLCRSSGRQASGDEFCAELMREVSTDDYSASTGIYGLAFECV